MPNNLYGLYQNVRSLRGKINRALKTKLTLENLDFVSMTETWLNDDFSSSELFDETYNVFRCDRSVERYNQLRPNESNRDLDDDIRGGGCLFAIKNHISAIRLTEWEKETLFDSIWIQINTGGDSKVFINTVYIPPWAIVEHRRQYYEHVIDVINTREPFSRFILLGDFNVPAIYWFPSDDHQTAIQYEGRIASELVDLLNACNLTQKNGVKNGRLRILDLVISNIKVSIRRRDERKILISEDNDHPTLDLVIDKSNIKFLKANKTAKLNFFNANYENINREIQLIDWNIELQADDINDSVDKFYSIINKIITNNTPITIPKPDKFPKWFSFKLIEMIRDKEYYRKKMKQPNNELYGQLFAIKRKEIKREKRMCLAKYIANIEPVIKTNPKSFFAYTKAQKQNNKLPSSMVYKSKLATNMKETARLFAEYFSSVYRDHANTFEIDMDRDSNNDFQIDSEMIAKILSEINETKTNSPDGIPGIFYKRTAETIKIPLLILFSRSIELMVYPKKWKHSFISPIFKSGNNTNVENYRPISILSAIAKVFDKLIFLHIREITSHILTECQHGFCLGKSSLSNLLIFTDYITKNMMGGGQVDAIFMDLAKAFDKIDHSILLGKLQRLNINPRLLRLLQSYLKDRTQTVCVYGAQSEPITPKSSVPQGSILSPLLFALFINDLPPLIITNILLFADDLKIYFKINSQEDARKLQRDIDTISHWCRVNKLEINIAKCNVISFTHRTEITFKFFNYNIGGVTLNRVNQIRDLGVIFDNKLSFESHITNITTKAYKMLGFISRSLNHFTQLSTYKLLYFTYVRSKLEYNSPVWSPHTRIGIDMIEKVQRRFTRIIFRRFHYPSEINFMMRNIRLDLLSLEDRRSIADEMTLYKINNGNIKSSLTEQLRFNDRIRVTRQMNIFYPSVVRTNVEYFSPLLRMQRQHDEKFSQTNLNEPSLCAFKRHAMFILKENLLHFDYAF